jgi:hypothetical protein
VPRATERSEYVEVPSDSNDRHFIASLALGSPASCGAGGNEGEFVLPPFNSYYATAT